MATPENKLAFEGGWEYSPAPESTDHIKVAKKYELFIGGDFVKPASGKYFDTINPATEERLSRVALANNADVDKAVKAARKAYNGAWSRMKPADRGKYIYRIARIIQERAREFAAIESLDGGKPIREARDVDVPLAAAHFFYYAGWADKLEYAFPGRRVRSMGVAGQIIPWNFPLLMAAWKLAPALACGNTVVLKPAETTPLTALKLAEVIADAGLPEGVVNIVTGAGDTGAAIVSHPGVDKIAFTGSTDVGRIIQKALAGSKKKYTLELGGKAANIIFADAAIDQAVEGIGGPVVLQADLLEHPAGRLDLSELGHLLGQAGHGREISGIPFQCQAELARGLERLAGQVAEGPGPQDVALLVPRVLLDELLEIVGPGLEVVFAEVGFQRPGQQPVRFGHLVGAGGDLLDAAARGGRIAEGQAGRG